MKKRCETQSWRVLEKMEGKGEREEIERVERKTGGRKTG
jgi:hypothetical protein